MLNRFHGRINVAVEMWFSPEGAEYLCLMAHYIDEEWKLQKKILNFITLDSSYTRDMLSDEIIKCLVDWDLECKLFAMTFDEFSTNDNIVLRIKDCISQNRPLLSNGQLFDVHSAAHILNSVVQDALVALLDVTQMIQGSVRYVKSSQATRGKFNEIAQQVGINSQKSLVLDSPNNWNSTYFMLETASEYKAAFCLLQEQDPGYTSVLTTTEWEQANAITNYLKITTVSSANKCPTSNMYFSEICDVHIQLIEWSKNTDSFLSSVAVKMKAKFDRYWSWCSLALAVAAILDTWFKIKLAEYYYFQICGSTALDLIKEVSDGIKELFNAYSICSTKVDQGSTFPGNTLPWTTADSRDRLKGFDKFLHETSQSHRISDLDKYLEEPVFPRNFDFNMLNWWGESTLQGTPSCQ